jgi:hypothetical protein
VRGSSQDGAGYCDHKEARLTMPVKFPVTLECDGCGATATMFIEGIPGVSPSLKRGKLPPDWVCFMFETPSRAFCPTCKPKHPEPQPPKPEGA